MGFRIVVDRDLCQGHGVCESEAPDVFAVPKHGNVEVLRRDPARERSALPSNGRGSTAPPTPFPLWRKS